MSKLVLDDDDDDDDDNDDDDIYRYTGHKNNQYKIDSCLNHEDTLVVSGSEDGKVYMWDLIDVSHFFFPVNVVECQNNAYFRR